MSNLQSFSIAPLTGEKDIILGLDGKVVLLVNVASQCGLTSHYAGLQKLYEELKSQDFTVVGLPCNQFGAHESNSNWKSQSSHSGWARPSRCWRW